MEVSSHRACVVLQLWRHGLPDLRHESTNIVVHPISHKNLHLMISILICSLLLTHVALFQQLWLGCANEGEIIIVDVITMTVTETLKL